MDWRNAGKRTRIGIFDGSVIGPCALCLVAFDTGTIGFLLVYAAVNAYITHRGRTMAWVLRRVRFSLRGGVVVPYPAGFWRKLLG